MSAIEDEIRKAAPADYPQIESKLIAVLRNSQATVAGKQFACRMLERVGSKKSVPVLASMLGDEKLSYMARFALERMSAPEAAAALREGLNRVKGRQLVGVIASLGQKRDDESVEKLASMVNDPDPDVAHPVGGAVVVLGERAVEGRAQGGAPPAPDARLRIRRPAVCCRGSVHT